jgi:hypothetical protein
MKTIMVTIAFVLLSLYLYHLNANNAVASENIMMTADTTNKKAITNESKNSSTSAEKSIDIAFLTVQTLIDNKCKPNSTYTGIMTGDLFTNHIFTSRNNVTEKPFTIPASDQGWTIKLFPVLPEEIIQYDVKQGTLAHEDMRYILGNAMYTPDCQGTIKAGQNKTCIISNSILSPLEFH